MLLFESQLERMGQRKFPPLDPLRLRTITALDQVEALRDVLKILAKQQADHDTHMLGCKSEREYKRQLRENR